MNFESVVERLSRRLAESRVLVGDLRFVERCLHVEHGLFRRLEDCIKAA
jgi:hypothetical protein